jgi:hypothetical protein
MSKSAPSQNIVVAAVIVLVMFGGILVSKAAGWWITETVREPVSYTAAEAEFEGLPNPADIRGSFTLGDISRFFQIPMDVLVSAFSLVNADETFRVGNLEGLIEPSEDGGEIGTDSIRLFAARYAGLPYIPDEGTLLPLSALNALEGILTPADIDALRAIAVETGEIDASAVVEEDHDEEETVAEIKGGTTFYDLLQWGVSSGEIEAVLGREMGPTSQTVRDFVLAAGLDYNSAKAALQELVDRYQ